MTDTPHAPVSVRWARFRFQVVGSLFASPPEPGELGRRLDELAARTYQHPTRSHEQLRIGRSTIERWYYTARSAEHDPHRCARAQGPRARGHPQDHLRRARGRHREAAPRAPELEHLAALRQPGCANRVRARAGADTEPTDGASLHERPRVLQAQEAAQTETRRRVVRGRTVRTARAAQLRGRARARALGVSRERRAQPSQ